MRKVLVFLMCLVALASCHSEHADEWRLGEGEAGYTIGLVLGSAEDGSSISLSSTELQLTLWVYSADGELVETLTASDAREVGLWMQTLPAGDYTFVCEAICPDGTILTGQTAATLLPEEAQRVTITLEPTQDDVELTFTLTLVHETDMPLIDEEETTETKSAVSAQELGDAGYGLRHVVEIYKKTDGAFGREALARAIYIYGIDEGVDHTVELSLPAGDYRAICWTDYTLAGSEDDLFYSTADFANIELLGDHEGCNDFRDCFRGTQDFTLTAQQVPAVSVEMQRPVGKFTFVTNDLSTFQEAMGEVLRAQMLAEEGATRADVSVDLSQFVVRFVYSGFMPNVYNLYTDWTADAATGVSFEGRIEQLTEQTARLGFDYVFVPTEASAVSVVVQVWDAEGQTLLSQSSQKRVPTQQGRHTIVEGAYLTQQSGAGVGVLTQYDGSFNIRYE